MCVPAGIPQQHSSACQGFQRISQIGHRQNSEAHEGSGHVPCQHRAGTEEGKRKNREGEDAEAHGKILCLCPFVCALGVVVPRDPSPCVTLGHSAAQSSRWDRKKERTWVWESKRTGLRPLPGHAHHQSDHMTSAS